MARRKYERQGYSRALAERLCKALAEGRSMHSICGDKDMPSRKTALRWLAANAEFRALYARARDIQAETVVDEILDIADDARNDWIVKGSRLVLNIDNIRRARQRIAVRIWMANVMAPHKYGSGSALLGTGKAPEVGKVVREIVWAGKNTGASGE